MSKPEYNDHTFLAHQLGITTAMHEYTRMELEELYQLIRSYDSSRWQIAVFFGTANVTALSIGLSQRQSGIVLVSSIFLFMFLIADSLLKRSLAVPLFRGYQLETRYASDKPGLFELYIATHASEPRILLSHMKKLSSEDETILVGSSLRHLFSGLFVIRSGTPRLMLIAIVAEILVGIALTWLGWSLF